MEGDSIIILQKMLGGFVRQIVKEVLCENGEYMPCISKDIEEIKQTLATIEESLVANSTKGLGEHARTIFGVWHEGDVVFMRDRKLWDKDLNPDAPFKSRDAVQRLKKSRPNLFFKNEQGYNTAFAEDLFEYICNQQARDIAAGKGIRTNNKRK